MEIIFGLAEIVWGLIIMMGTVMWEFWRLDLGPYGQAVTIFLTVPTIIIWIKNNFNI